jgi:hypothetical protein
MNYLTELSENQMIELGLLFLIVTVGLEYKRVGIFSPGVIIGFLFSSITILYIVTGFRDSSDESFQAYLFWILMSIGIVNILPMKQNINYNQKYNLRHERIVMVVSFIVAFILLFNHYKLTNFVPPILYLASEFATGVGTSYKDYDLGFQTTLLFAIGRIMPLALISLREKAIRDRVSIKYYYVMFLVTLGGVFTLGLRNIILWPVIYFLFLGSSTGRVFLSRKMIVTTCFGLVLFVVLGNLRLGTSLIGNPFEGRIRQLEGANAMFLWIFLYSVPSLLNLNNLFMKVSHDTPYNGLLLLSGMLPGVDFESVKTSMDYITENQLLEFYGITFRTIYADLLLDFGIIGSLLVAFLIMVIYKLVFYMSLNNRKYGYIYCTILPSIVFFPFLNILTGLANLLPVLVIFIIMRKK